MFIYVCNSAVKNKSVTLRSSNKIIFIWKKLDNNVDGERTILKDNAFISLSQLQDYQDP